MGLSDNGLGSPFCVSIVGLPMKRVPLGVLISRNSAILFSPTEAPASISAAPRGISTQKTGKHTRGKPLGTMKSVYSRNVDARPPSLSGNRRVRLRRTLATNAIHMSPIPEMEYALIYGERTLRSVTKATFQDGVEFLHLAAEIPIRVSMKLYELEDANQALVDLKRSRIDGAGVLKI